MATNGIGKAMIKEIWLKNIATYDNQGAQFRDLKPVNFIYGSNGCGKTTLSNFIHNSADSKFRDCCLVWANGTSLKCLVYNKEFRDRNFGKGKLNGVFTLGEATNEQIKEIDAKREELKAIKAEGIQKKETCDKLKADKEALETDFKDATWLQVYKKYEGVFKESYGSHQKEPFKNKLLVEFKSNAAQLYSFDDLKEKALTVFGEKPQRIDEIPPATFDKAHETESSPIWNKKIVGKSDVDISSLIKRLNINDWVDQGRAYIQDDTCPFCQQKTITEAFKAQIEGYFDETYSTEIALVKDLKQKYDSLSQNYLSKLNSIELSQKELKSTKLNVEKYSACLKALESQLTTNNELLNRKAKEPSTSIDLVSTKELANSISELIDQANLEIKKHNAIVTNYEVEKAGLTKAIWRFLIEESRANTETFISKKSGLEKGIANLEVQISAKRNEYQKLDAEIKELSKNVTSVQPAIDKINKILNSYGFINFEIVSAKEDGFYQILRADGSIAEATLSEGEVTFITFLYYLQLAVGATTKEEVNTERVLVIDDPISSLDSNVLFIVSTLIKDIIKGIKSDSGNIKQLILLTHNVYFHKEVSFIDGRTKICNKTNFWHLRKIDKVTTLQSFEMYNPIQSSYELLWQELRSNEKTSCLTVQNIMRRIVENYFKLLGKYGDDDLIMKFDNKEEQEICRSLISWINDGSHSINDDLFIEHQDRTIQIYKKVFKDIFVLTDHVGHYKMMMNEAD